MNLAEAFELSKSIRINSKESNAGQKEYTREQQESIRNLFMETFGVHPSKGVHCPRRLTGKHCLCFSRSFFSKLSTKRCECINYAAQLDHPSLWLNSSGKPHLYACQPCQIEEEHKKAYRFMSNKYSLVISLDEFAPWHSAFCHVVIFRLVPGSG